MSGPRSQPITLQPRGAIPASIDRSDDRRVTVLGLGLAAGFLALAAISVFIPNLRGPWLPLHLVLAGAATVAIGSVMPFFASALVAGQPAPAPIRLGIVGLLASGALAVTVGFGADHGALAVTGGLLFITGLILLLGLTVAILRGSVGAKRRVFTVVYGTAIANVMVGATIATLFLGLQPDIAAAWPTLKPAHAWLNLFGFVGLVVCGSLVHLFPTVVGARMDRSWWSAGAVMALAVAPPIVALGYILRVDLVAQAGGLTMVAGTTALLVVAARMWRSRGGWTTDAAWHAMAMGALWGALAWFGVGVGIASGHLLTDGARPEGWSVTPLIAPLGIGFVIQVMIGAWTHLLPAIGPGSPRARARSRTGLGRFAWPRLALLNTGVALMVIGQVNGSSDASRLGFALAGIGVLASLALFAITAAGVVRAERKREDLARAPHPEPGTLGG